VTMASIASWSFEAIPSAPGDGHRPGRVEVEVELDGESLWVRVRDRGHGLEPRIDSPGLGLGLPLISQISASSQIVSPDEGGTEVIMRFDLHEHEDGH
jgi:stage II sporulation protein AB (anti-sigma F factor)